MKEEYIVYCDESAKKGKYFGNFYGGAIVNSKQIDKLTSSLNKKKLELNLFGEIKWSKVTESYLEKYVEKQVIEIAPLAFMRGRTLNDAVVILDEAQNATCAQMKMFLTRMGKNCKMVVTGDVTQIDLIKKKDSGLMQACTILDHIDGISIIHLENSDVVRNPLVQKIIERYAKVE